MNILITSGPVHAPLDDNKIVSNRSRGLWAARFAIYLARQGHHPTLLVPDLQAHPSLEGVRIWQHSGYEDYRRQCIGKAHEFGAVVLAAAVTNYIPKTPFHGKMPTDADEISIQFVKAPSVINEIRRANPLANLIGCKLTIGASRDDTVLAAQHVLQASRAHAVVGNDKSCLNTKLVCFPDGSVHTFDIKKQADDLFAMLTDTLQAAHFRTDLIPHRIALLDDFRAMDHLLKDYGWRFGGTFAKSEKLWGSLAVRTENGQMLCTPRIKHPGLRAAECPIVQSVNFDFLRIAASGKVSINAPLLWRMLIAFPNAAGVVHLHETETGLPRVPYALPGTAKDSLRDIPGPAFEIEGHGTIFCIRANGNRLVC